MQVKEAIILAGGLGTRLRSAVPDLPKCMAPVAGRPFIAYVIDYLRMQGVERFIFALGYKAEDILAYLKQSYPTLQYEAVLEEEPLGTGGAIHLALQKAKSEMVLALNGDTLFRVRVADMVRQHREKNSECTLALKPMRDFDRYGAVSIDEDGRIRSFQEKQFYAEGLINGGVYLIQKDLFLEKPFPPKFSFEKDYLEKYAAEAPLYGSVQEGYFIDIGIPEDLFRADAELKQSAFDPKAVDRHWTLFLDRDGVINNERVGNYVLHPGEFHFSEGVLEAFRLLGQKFGRILVVSNQRGVGRGLMTEDDLTAVHTKMRTEVAAAGGRIERIYYCTDPEDTHFHRKPNPGMAWQAVTEFPDIDLNRSIMVGNKPSDMRFGRAAGMFTVFLTTTNPDQPFPHPDIDLIFPSLLDFARSLG